MLGMLSVIIPLVYGEGEKVFGGLEDIMKATCYISRKDSYLLRGGCPHVLVFSSAFKHQKEIYETEIRLGSRPRKTGHPLVIFSCPVM